MCAWTLIVGLSKNGKMDETWRNDVVYNAWLMAVKDKGWCDAA